MGGDAGVKKYVALLTQSGGDPPVAIVLENTIGDIVWSYEAPGIYRADLINGFPIDKTVVMGTTTYYPADTETASITYQMYDQPDKIYLFTKNINTEVPSDEVLQSTPIEIRVYP